MLIPRQRIRIALRLWMPVLVLRIVAAHSLVKYDTVLCVFTQKTAETCWTVFSLSALLRSKYLLDFYLKRLFLHINKRIYHFIHKDIMFLKFVSTKTLRSVL